MLDPELLKHLNDRRPIPREWVNFPEISGHFDKEPRCNYPRRMANALGVFEVFQGYRVSIPSNRIYIDTSIEDTWSIPINSIIFGKELESIEEC